MDLKSFSQKPHSNDKKVIKMLPIKKKRVGDKGGHRNSTVSNKERIVV